jgi:hypothetical protein
MTSRTIQRSQGYTIHTPPALAALSNRFQPIIIQDGAAPVPSPNADYFSRIEITANSETDSGSHATIHVQMDNRFMANYIQFHIVKEYPEFNVKGHPMASTLSMAGYCMLLLNAHFLCCEFYRHNHRSRSASDFLTDANRRAYFEVLQNAYVPAFLTDILREIAPVYDPRRRDHLLLPSLACYSHRHDFGRTLPPHIWLLSHNHLATANQRADPDDYANEVAELEVVQYEQQDFTIANYLGTRYGDQHDNWVNQDFESFFNPLTGRTHTQRPTLSKLALTRPAYNSFEEFKTYEFFLLADEDNVHIMSNFVGSLSAVFQNVDPKAQKLGTIQASVSGSLMFNHSIEPPTLPTWTGIKPSKHSGNEISDRKFASNHSYLVDSKAFTGAIPWVNNAVNFLQHLYRLEDKKSVQHTRSNKRVIFDPALHVLPYVLYSQPYDVSPSSIALTIVAGIKIELAEVDGITIPVEHPESSLDDNNSQFHQSGIPLSQVRPILDSADPNVNSIRILRRRLEDRNRQARAIALRDMSRVVMPHYGNQNVNEAAIGEIQHPGFTYEMEHDDPRTAFTYAATDTKRFPLDKKMKIYAWSSYRIMIKSKPKQDDILMLVTLRHIYGLNTTLSRTKNPALLIPH